MSPELAQYLSRNAGVLDAVIGGDFFRDWPGRPALEQALAERLAAIDDYERKLDTRAPGPRSGISGSACISFAA